MHFIQPFSDTTIEYAVKLLSQHNVIGMPTETVYGLAGDATSDQAVAKIYQLKNRPVFNPLIIHVLNKTMAQELAIFNHIAYQLINIFWPGPLTIILPRHPSCAVSLLASAGQSTIALRMPSHPIALKVLDNFGKPIAAPSANKSGRISPTEAQDVAQEFGQSIPLILDGGACTVGIESTIVEIDRHTINILRPGGVTQEQLQQIAPTTTHNDTEIKAPGMLKSHYAPSLPVRLCVKNIDTNEGLLAFGSIPSNLVNARIIFNLSPTGDLTEAAANLFRGLRYLDQPTRIQQIAVMRIPMIGLGQAINDRLQRAAADRQS
jgi:L-threonylcarbamoyladenylate synthase